MAKVALLIGVRHYGRGFHPLPGTSNDVAAIKRVLHSPEIGGFDQIDELLDPEPTTMGMAIQALFDGRKRDDLVLLYFSGHGVKDDRGRLYLSTSLTATDERGGLIKATAIPASFIHDLMNHSRAKRQVIVLDCCFSGAFAEGLSAKDDGLIDIKHQLLNEAPSPTPDPATIVEGRVVLTSASSTQYAFEQGESALSVYTQYLVEGLETGAADQDNDEVISVDELHEFAARKVQEAAPAMKPEIYAIKQGYKIAIASALIGDPRLKYRKEAERFSSHGKISPAGRAALDRLQQELGLGLQETRAIEAETIQPYREYRRKLQEYGRVYRQMSKPSGDLGDRALDDLKHLQRVLKLRDEDVTPLERYIRQKYYGAEDLAQPLQVEPPPPSPATPQETIAPSLPASPRPGLAEPPRKPRSPTAKKRTTNSPTHLALMALTAMGLVTAGVTVQPEQCRWPNPLTCFVYPLDPPLVQQALDQVHTATILTLEARTRAQQQPDWQPSHLRKEWNAIAFNWQEAIGFIDRALATQSPDDADALRLNRLRQIAADELAYATAIVNSITATDLALANRQPDRWQDLLDKEQWQTIVALWEEAIALLEGISSDNSEPFRAAQPLINRYRDELSNAQQAQAYAPLRRALAIAQEAEQLQAARPQASHEWLRIASLWDQAVDELEQVDGSVQEYFDKAETRIPLYRRNLARAQAMASE